MTPETSRRMHAAKARRRMVRQTALCPMPCKHCGKMPAVIPISSFYRYMVRCGNHQCPVMPRTRHLGTSEIAIGCWNHLNAPCPENREPLADRESSLPNVPVRRILIEDLRAGTRHELMLYPSARRRDQFRVEVDGREWKQAIGYSRLLAGVRKAR